MPTPLETQAKTQQEATPLAKEQTPKDKFVRSMVSYLCTDKIRYYSRGENCYIDTSAIKGTKLLNLESGEFSSFILRLAKKGDNIFLRTTDANLIVDHVRLYAHEHSIPLSPDNRAAFSNGSILLNTGWDGNEHIVIDTKDGTWGFSEVTERIFEPIPPEMRLVRPVPTKALEFPALLRRGIADFGANHCLISVSCATMLLPAVFPHPFLIFTGDQARGKSTTMKLLLQLIDPYANGELMSVGEDTRDLVALCRDRHCIALDNVTTLPFDEDLLSKMYSGGIFAARKMTTNSELSKAMMPRLRVMMNGIGTSFNRSDLLSRCIFIEHPVLTERGDRGQELFVPLGHVEERWRQVLPEALGALLGAVGEGWGLYLRDGELDGKRSECRYVEYAVIGECMSRAMGFEPGLFTAQVNAASHYSAEKGVEADDCAESIVAFLNGERGAQSQLEGFDGAENGIYRESDGSIVVSPTSLYNEVRGIAAKRGWSTYSLKWLVSGKAFHNAIVKSESNIRLSGWEMRQIQGGERKRHWKCWRNNLKL
jgi:energy-coupling factor transporter ATP-binding protein EcfA2